MTAAVLDVKLQHPDSLQQLLRFPMSEGKADRSSGALRRPKAARDKVRANLNARDPQLRALIMSLVEETGHSRQARCRFARSTGMPTMRAQKHGRFPGAAALYQALDWYPVSGIPKLMRRSRSSIWHPGANAKMGRQLYRTLGCSLHGNYSRDRHLLVQPGVQN